MNILSFDIEEWFHCDFISDRQNWDNYEVRIHSSVDRILEHLSSRKLRGTFFVLGWIAEKYPEVVKKIHDLGHEIGAHSYYHGLVHKMSRAEFYDDTERVIKRLEDIVGESVLMYRAPGFSITENTPWAFEVLAELGIKFDCSVFPSAHDYGGFPGFGSSEPAIIDVHGVQMKEFPMNTIRVFNKNLVFSGGGFFRLFPYPLIRKWTNQSHYVMSYIHPRDFDSDQPVLKHLPLMRKFKSYYGLRKAFGKYEQWTKEFATMSLLEADRQIDWTKAKVIKLT